MKDKECIVCGTRYNLHSHHVYFGSNRQVSEKLGMKVWLCQEHHEGVSGVHGKYGESVDALLKMLCQIHYEKNNTRQEFIDAFGRDYLGSLK